jgi:putative cardiolipin synthase
MVIDDSHVFIGSYNIDPRSTAINTEQGVLIANPDLARELTLIFDEHLAAEHAWQVQQMDGRLRWSDGQATWTRDPQAGISRRVQAWLTRWLPVHSQL